MTASTVMTVVDVPRHAMGVGFDVAGVRNEHLGRSMDPYLSVDAFAMAHPFFPPHPHAGFSAVTYILPESEGGFINRDSLGDVSTIRPGGLHWTEAARGMMHEETPIIRGVTARGLQIFVNLPLSEKLADPRVHHAEPESVPEIVIGEAKVRVLVGDLAGVTAAVVPRTVCGLWDVTLPPHGALAVPMPSGWRGFGLLVGGGIDGFPPITGIGVVRFEDDAGVFSLRAGSRGARLVIFAGPPLDEPVVFGGPFAMGSADQLADAKRRFGTGEMGHLDPSF